MTQCLRMFKLQETMIGFLSSSDKLKTMYPRSFGQKEPNCRHKEAVREHLLPALRFRLDDLTLLKSDITAVFPGPMLSCLPG